MKVPEDYEVGAMIVTGAVALAIVRWDAAYLLLIPAYFSFAMAWPLVNLLMTKLGWKKSEASAETLKPAQPSSADCHRTAIHEAGHLVVGGAVGMAASIESASIVPSPGCRGHVARRDEGTEPNLTRQGYRDQIAFCLGGRIAEELLFSDGADNGSRGDLRQASIHATHMLDVAGFSEGKLEYLQLDKDETVSEDMLVMLEGQKRREIQTQAKRAKTILETNRALLDEIAEKLLEVGTLEGAELTLLLCRIQIPT